eukprot:4313161-Amphidinium_carterae.1
MSVAMARFLVTQPSSQIPLKTNVAQEPIARTSGLQHVMTTQHTVRAQHTAFGLHAPCATWDYKILVARSAKQYFWMRPN